ncbi:hypothetical protein [Brucella pituitosa]|uniref:Uncharacterized protein n=1 Tax=Brucella pituitosa TaxID=571256 RepID=A0A643EU04_9HYPH|nr:hypothetical protein [Brucella pituitosa]KAB0566114.1 hypothetical protein F7Q93_21980 [Brucella pituitosa]
MSLTNFLARQTQIKTYTPKHDATGFFLQETLRFISIAGSLKYSNINLNLSATVDDRYFSHILLRSLLENYFTNIWLFDDLTLTSKKYNKVLEGFAHDYIKLINDLNGNPTWKPFLTGAGSKLEPLSSLTVSGIKGMPVSSMLANMKRYAGARPDYLYPLYRITSFDVHGRSLSNVMEASFNKTGLVFPILDVDTAIDAIAVDYENVLDDLINNSLI